MLRVVIYDSVYLISVRYSVQFQNQDDAICEIGTLWRTLYIARCKIFKFPSRSFLVSERNLVPRRVFTVLTWGTLSKARGIESEPKLQNDIVFGTDAFVYYNNAYVHSVLCFSTALT